MVPIANFLEACELHPKFDQSESEETAKLWEASEAQRKEGLRLLGHLRDWEEGFGIFEEQEVVFASY